PQAEETEVLADLPGLRGGAAVLLRTLIDTARQDEGIHGERRPSGMTDRPADARSPRLQASRRSEASEESAYSLRGPRTPRLHARPGGDLGTRPAMGARPPEAVRRSLLRRCSTTQCRRHCPARRDRWPPGSSRPPCPAGCCGLLWRLAGSESAPLPLRR